MMRMIRVFESKQAILMLKDYTFQIILSKAICKKIFLMNREIDENY